MHELVIFVVSFAAAVSAYFWWIAYIEVKRLNKRYAPMINVDSYVARGQLKRRQIHDEIKELQASYKDKRHVYDGLLEQIAIFDETISFAEFGVYEPHFDFGDSEPYKWNIQAVRQLQKDAISAKVAIEQHTTWTVDGSSAKGQTMANRGIRLALRAFNAEADAAIANTRWNNAEAMLRRLRNARSQIDKANASLQIEISDAYLKLKEKELRLTHEYREQLKIERDLRSEERRLAREEKRLEQEAAKALAREEEYKALLQQARAEVGVTDSYEQLVKIAELERQLAEAQNTAERAKAMAEKTKSGFVYIISNIGSFGDGIVKIGLTRRLDPTDRVRELGDASVPFLFDTHAMIYSDEAPALEAALHARFDDRRINAANMRKEFFRVSLNEVEQAVHELAPGANFHKDIEAQEFRETMAKRQQLLEAQSLAAKHLFPETI